MKSDFEKKKSEVLSYDENFDFLGVQHWAQIHTQAGLSSLASGMGFFDPVDEEGLEQVPDYILSDTLEKDIDNTVQFMGHYLVKTKYFPNETQVWVWAEATTDVARQRVVITDWEDYEIINYEGNPLYTKEILSEAEALSESRLATALYLIVKDICDEGRMFSEDWYRARIVFEYFREPLVQPESAFLIGMLFKELCTKQTHESDLSAYYQKLTENGINRKRGTETTQQKAEELRAYCVELFVEMADQIGYEFTLATPMIQAKQLRQAALSRRPEDFMRNGKPYSERWFLTKVIEDQKIQITKMLNLRRR